MNEKIRFRAWDESQKYMAYQGTADIETLQSFIHHFGDKELMQSTNIFDINGIEIFEGDYLKSFGKSGKFSLHKVFRVQGGLAINIYDSGFHEENPRYVPVSMEKGIEYLSKYTVSGNIYENEGKVQ